MNFACIIPARGGSKGIPKKNILPLCGNPLIGWSITQARHADELKNNTYVSSDSQEILEVAESFGAIPILRPDEISTDTASSESAILHALDAIEKRQGKLDALVFLQATSPLRKDNDISNAIEVFIQDQLDSLFSATPLEDFFIWKKGESGYESLNYDYKNRKRRQEVEQQVVENGSVYIFKPELMRENNNRLGGKIGISLMDSWQVHEIDSAEDIALCEYYIQTKLLNRRVRYE